MQGWCGKLSYERKLKLWVQTQLPTTVRTNFSINTINTYLPKISPVMNNKSTDRQVYNESKQQSGNLLVYHSKTTVVYYYYFYLLEWKNLNELE